MDTERDTEGVSQEGAIHAYSDGSNSAPMDPDIGRFEIDAT